MRMVGALLGIWLALALAACGTGASGTGGQAADDSPASGTLNVVATTTLVADAVRQVAGDRVSLTTMLPVGTDTHSYEPSPRDIAAVADADLVFINGAGLEGFIEPLIANAGGSATVVDLSQGLPLLDFDTEHADEAEHTEDQQLEATAEPQAQHAEDEHAEDEHATGKDPHVWFSPANVEAWTSTIEASLSEHDSANAASYKTNGAAYRAKLQALDGWIKDQVAQIPQERRTLVTDHDTFGYLADRYGFQLVGAVIPGISTAAEPSPQELAAIQDAVRDYNVPAIFVASEVGASLAQRVADDTGVKLVRVYVESLGEPGGPADSYEAFMRYDIEQIVAALK